MVHVQPVHERSIPAHAGEPAATSSPASPTTVYPRPRGGAGVGAAVDAGGEGPSPPTPGAKRSWSMGLRGGGPSPPTRGSPGHLPLRVHRRGSIPAHAGEPRSDAPHVGSIPAHAGEPGRGVASRARRRVHPRPRGGAALSRRGGGLDRGPSPPTRGSREELLLELLQRGSIPAHAGEPARAPRSHPPRGVHPRPRGGASPGTTHRHRPPGPSPPTRGSRACAGEVLGPAGSIPAHAGEPRRGVPLTRPSRVHPRPRGGARGGDASRAPTTGPSPPTRGSRSRGRGRTTPRGSIPAHAGEPARRARRRGAPRVHPRPRGGALGAGGDDQHPLGRAGSIPAHAGEPA